MFLSANEKRIYSSIFSTVDLTNTLIGISTGDIKNLDILREK
jgi:hypothetical protein